MANRPSADELLGPSFNFQITQAERVRAAGGLPAHLRRLGRIEQISLRAKVINERVAAGLEKVEALELLLLSINVLIEAHNDYFPIEANLPIDPKTGLPLHGDDPFKPLPLVTRASLR